MRQHQKRSKHGEEDGKREQVGKVTQGVGGKGRRVESVRRKGKALQVEEGQKGKALQVEERQKGMKGGWQKKIIKQEGD